MTGLIRSMAAGVLVTLLFSSTSLAAGPDARVATVREDPKLHEMKAVYDLERSERLLEAQRPTLGNDAPWDVRVPHAEWQARDKRIALDVPFVRPRPVAADQEDLRRWGLRFRIKLLSAAALGGRRTRVTLLWSGMKRTPPDRKRAWSEQQICLRVNGKCLMDSVRASSASVAGRRLSIIVPAASVLRNDGLDIALYLAERTEWRDAAYPHGGVSADALELELLP